jgi:hypothetical protein
MRIVSKLRTSAHRSPTRGARDLARALASAPTRASREELLNLQNMGR